MGVKQNANQPRNVLNLSKSVFLHTDVMQRIVAIPYQTVVAGIDRSQNVIIR